MSNPFSIEARGMSGFYRNLRESGRQNEEHCHGRRYKSACRTSHAYRDPGSAIPCSTKLCIDPESYGRAMNSTDETLGVEEAAALLRAETSTVMQFARRGDLPGTRIGKGWVFLREDVIAFLRQQIANDTQDRRQQAARTIAAVAFTAPQRSRRTKLPILPALPVTDPAKKSP